MSEDDIEFEATPDNQKKDYKQNWDNLKDEEKVVAAAVALSHVSITIPYLEQQLEKSFSDLGKNGDIHKMVGKILFRLINIGVVEVITPAEYARKMAQKNNNLIIAKTYSQEKQISQKERALHLLKELEKNPQEGNKTYLSVSKSYQEFARSPIPRPLKATA